MDKNFLLNTKTAERLYYETAKNLPVMDYHNHLCLPDISKNKQFENITELWIKADPYKHRAMRICGVDEEYITGGAPDFEKFKKWSEIVPRLIGNPLYDWVIMELETVFGISTSLCADTAEEIWKKTNEKLKCSDFFAQNLLKGFNVEYAAPCASAADDIEDFFKIDGVSPSLRGDDIVSPDAEFIKKLENRSGCVISGIDSYMAAIEKQIDLFHMAGCRFSDHGIDDEFVYFEDFDEKTVKSSVVLNNKNDKAALSSEILRRLAGLYAKLGWTMQLHIGAKRSTSARLRKIAGAAGGFAGIGNGFDISYVINFLNDAEKNNGLPKTVLFTLNPADNAVMSVLCGSFSQDGVVAKVSQGPAWWWCDHINGIRNVFESISSFGVLSTFIGMTTDSRSILSFVRHDYFRRVLCGWLGEKVKNGEYPDDFENLSLLVKNMCYNNVKECIKNVG